MSLTTDPNDSRLKRGIDEQEVPQNEAYLVLPKEELEKGFVRPIRTSYIHNECGTVTSMNQTIAETYARDPKFYGATFCVGCNTHFPVNEFVWDKDGETLGS